MFDAVIVGSGATGSWAAKILTEGGLEVALIEAGPTISAQYISDNITPQQVAQRSIQSLCSGYRGRARGLFVNDLENPYRAPPDAPFNWFRNKQVGGRLNTWSRHVPRVSDIGFLPSADGDERSWPLNYEQLAPSYSRVERRLGVHGELEGLAVVPDGEFLHPLCGPSVLEADIRRSLARANPMLNITRGRVARHHKSRIPLALEDAMGTGRLTLISNTIATSINPSGSGPRSGSVSLLDRLTGGTGSIAGRVIVLAASAFESVRLLLNSVQNMPGLNPSSDTLGHFVCDHVFCTTGGPLRPDQHLAHKEWVGPVDEWDFGDTSLYFPGEISRSGNFEGRYGIQLALCPRGEPRWTAAAFGEMLPRYENFIKLDENCCDAWGQRVIHIECRHGINETAMAEQMQAHLSDLARSAGLIEASPLKNDCKRYTSHGSLLPGAAIHESGGARMGKSSLDSVLNSYCQSWKYDNIFVVDGACFPYLPFQNPTLTMMAITDRACAYILKNSALLGIGSAT